jgi:hypothetical protein
MSPEVNYEVTTGLWVTITPFSYEDVNIPQGFHCDLSSVPRWLWSLIAPFELSIAAPLVHDFLYKSGGQLPDSTKRYTRAEVDGLFLKIMKEEGVSFWRRYGAYNAVRLFGAKNFKDS